MSDTFPLDPFIKGKNNIAKETSLPEGSLRDAIDVDIDNDGHVRLREGYELVYSGENIRSFFDMHFVENDVLKFLNSDNTASDITNVSPVNNVSYCRTNDLLYITDGDTNQIINGFESKPLSVETPQQPSCTIIGSGSLDPGVYQVSCAFVDSDGVVYGSSLPTQTTLTNTGGIHVNIQQKVGYDTVVYVTPLNDPRLHEQIILPYGITTYMVYSVKVTDKICDTLLLSPMPAGHIIDYYKGKLYIAKDSVLWYSEPYHFGVTDLKQNFFQFPERISICIAVESGIFVVSDKTYFITFNKNEEASMRESASTKAVEGTGLVTSGANFNFEFESDVAYWFSEAGPIVGMPNGTTVFLTDDAVAVPNNTDSVGSSMFREYNGIQQIISSMPTGGEYSKLQSTDTATITVIRNGVIIE